MDHFRRPREVQRGHRHNDNDLGKRIPQHRLPPAERRDHAFKQRRPQRAGQVAAARNQGQCRAAPAIEPAADIYVHRRINAAEPVQADEKSMPDPQWPGRAKVESARPAPIIKAPQITVQRVPTRSAMRPMRMPPAPEPSQASELASAGIERVPSTSAAISLSATAVIHAEPNAIISVQSAAEATIQDARLSTEEVGCSMQKGSGWETPFYRLHGI